MLMRIRPGDCYRCGSFALAHLAESLHLDTQVMDQLLEVPSPDGGFNPPEVAERLAFGLAED